MSMKLSRYFIALILLIIIAIIGTSSVNATCYITPTGCMKTEPITTQVISVPDTAIGGSEYCISKYEEDLTGPNEIADQCVLSCCCVNSGNGYAGMFPMTRGYCVLNRNIVGVGTTSSECTDFCADFDATKKYNFTGYVLIGNSPVPGATVVVIYNSTVNITKMTDGNGFFNFTNIPTGNRALFANSSTCNRSDSISLIQTDMKHNITLDCANVNISGNVYKSGALQGNVRINITYNDQKYTTLSNAAGHYSFNVPSRIGVILEAYDADGCTFEDSFTVETTSILDEDVTLGCDNYDVNVRVQDDSGPINNARVSVGNKISSSGSAGTYTFLSITPGTYSVSASRTTVSEEADGDDVETTCEAHSSIILNEDKNIDLTLDSCCVKTTTYGDCIAGFTNKIVTSVGPACTNAGVVTTRQTCDLGASCWDCTNATWSTCDNGELESYRECARVQTACNENLPPPLMTQPCKTACGNGTLQTGEDCDLGPNGIFAITPACLGTWSEINPDVTEDYINENGLWNVVCNPSCTCASPATIPDIPDCSEDPGGVEFSGRAVNPLTKTINISWYLTKEACRDNVDHFELLKCEGEGCNNYISIDAGSLNINSATRRYGFSFDAPVQYCFELTTIFKDVIESRRSNTTTYCVQDIGDPECFMGETDNWCKDGNIVRCDPDSNNIDIVEQCAPGETCGIMSGVATCYAQSQCDVCNNFFGIHSYTGGTILDTESQYECPSMAYPEASSESGGCYLDYSLTSIDKAYSCSNTSSCYDYYSESSCTNDYCGKFQRDGIIDCEWTSYSYDGANAYRKGVCRPKNETKQDCSLCSSNVSNRLFPVCTKDICGMFGECYFEPKKGICMAKSQMGCGNYTNESECIGAEGSDPGRSVSTAVEWFTIDGERYDSAFKIRGNNIRTRSTDAIGLGVCFWNYDTDNEISRYNRNRQCIRNADNLDYIYNSSMGYGNDCIVSDPLLKSVCEHDTIPPVTVINNRSSVYGLYMNLTNQVNLSDNNPWPIGDSMTERQDANNQNFMKTYYCVVREGDAPCYPYKVMSLSRILDLKSLGMNRDDDGNPLTLYYFSQDPAKNLELIKSFDFSVDAIEPNVSIVMSMNSYPLSEYFWRTNLTVRISLGTRDESSPVTCAFNITPLTDEAKGFFDLNRNYGPLYNIPSMINTRNNRLTNTMDSITTTYPGLMDGIYKYEVSCTDALGNPSYTTGNFSVTGDMRINTPYPRGMVFKSDNVSFYDPDSDTFNISISVNTNNTAVCRYTTDPLSARKYFQMEGTMLSGDGTHHSARIAISQPSVHSAIYKYYIGCNISMNGRTYAAYSNDMSSPLFSLDDLAPKTKILYSTIVDGRESFIEYTNESGAFNYLRFNMVCDDRHPLLNSSSGVDMSFGCADDSIRYCIPTIAQSAQGCDPDDIDSYLYANSNIELDYQDSNSEHKRMYGNNPVIYYYSTDRGGNIAPPDFMTLQLRNTNFDGPTITFLLNDGNETAYPGDTIHSAFITVEVNFTGETVANVTNIELWHKGRSVQVPIEPVNGIINGTNTYKFTRPYFDNGAYLLTIDSIDDDTNTNKTIVGFSVSHANNAVWLVSPRLGIGQSQTYDITLATAYPGRCKYGFNPLEKCPIKACIYNDPTYQTLTSSGTTHTLIDYTHSSENSRMYVICWNSGSLDEYNDSSFVQTSFNVGYNTTAPTVNITFIQAPRTNPEDNRIINTSYNATRVQVFTDQPSVCQINTSLGRFVLDIPLSPPTWFDNEDPTQYTKYYTVHNFTIDYKRTGAGPGIYPYTVNCTSLAQLSTVKGFDINFTTNVPAPVVRITPSETYIGVHRYNVTCQGLCMNAYQDTYYYAFASQSTQCANVQSSSYKSLSYSQLINVTNATKICVRVTDALGRIAYGETYADVRNLDRGQLTINYPYVYSFSGRMSHVYSPTQEFTLSISTPLNSVCRYTTDLNAQRYLTASDASSIASIYANSDAFTSTRSTTHTTPFSINANANYPEGYFITCMVQNVASGTDPYISRGMVFYWDNTAPSISAAVSPTVIIDWNMRDKVLFNVSTNDESRCVLDLENSIVNVTGGRPATSEALGTGNFSLDPSGSDTEFNSYKRNMTAQYNIPNAWLDDINLKATFNFDIKCWNRAKVHNDTILISRYDLASTVTINRTSGEVFNTTTVPVNVTTNINSTCRLILDNNLSMNYSLSTTNNLVHRTTLNVGSGGNHTVSITCGVDSNSRIAAGQETYQVIIDSERPVITRLWSVTGRNYTCGLDGFSINVEMSDDIGIAGYYYSLTQISPSATNAQFNAASGNYGLIRYNGTLTENTAYGVYVTAVDRAGRYSVPSGITIMARTPATSILCDLSNPQVAINTVDTPFSDMVKVNVTCTDDTGCRPIYYYSTTNNPTCDNATYQSSSSFSNIQTFMRNALLCVKVLDLAGNAGYGQKNITIGIDTSNPLNITPVDTDESFGILPNVIATTINPFNLTVSTQVNAECKYGINPINNVSVAELFNDRYRSFTQTGQRVHVIENFDVEEHYETYVDVICHSTAVSTQPYSRKVIRVVYTAVNPSISASANPNLIYDWNDRNSTIFVNTSPETWCTITSINNSDVQNTPKGLGDAFNALTYKTSHAEEFRYDYNSSRVFNYDVNCYTFTNMHNSTNFTVRYSISDVLTLTLLSSQLQRNRTADVIVETSLISECRLVWDGIDKGIMIANVSGRQHSIKVVTQAEGIHTYIAEVNCTAPVTGRNTVRAFNITIDTTAPAPRCGDGVKNRAVEQCDSNDLGGFSCTNGFTDSSNYVGGQLRCYPNGTTNECKFDFSNCDTGRGWCGNDRLDGPNSKGFMEQCDDKDGDVPSSVTCKSLGFKGGSVTCNPAACTLNTSRCTMETGTLGNNLPVCNNKILETGEQCELNSTISLRCTNFGYDAGSVSCNSTCMFDMGKCAFDIDDNNTGGPSCGNNRQEGKELCDGTDLNEFTCVKLSNQTKGINYTGGTLGCYKNCTFNVTKCIGVSIGVNASNKCTNGIKDGNETDKDCGGNCPACKTLNSTCTKDTDCSSGKCTQGKCVVNPCNNSVLDSATETDVDCGRTCKSCSLGKKCSTPADCSSGYCTATGTCAEDPCSNGMLDAGEIDTDCGGNCALCDVGQDCLTDEDCSSNNCRKDVCEEAKPPVNPIKFPLLIFAIISILGGGGYLVYRTFIEKKPMVSSSIRYPPFGSSSMPEGTNTIEVPVLTPEQRRELLRRQQEVMSKNKQSRMSARKSVLDKLEEDTAKDNAASAVTEVKKGKTYTVDDGEYVELSKLKKNDEEYIDLGKLKDKKSAESKDTFDKLKVIGGVSKTKSAAAKPKSVKGSKSRAAKVSDGSSKDSMKKEAAVASETAVENTKSGEDKPKEIHKTGDDAESDKVARQISDISGKPHEDIKSQIENDKKMSHTEALKMFGELDKDTLMSKAFTDVLSKLLDSGKISKENVSNILFEYMDKGLLNKSDVARISSDLKII